MGFNFSLSTALPAWLNILAYVNQPEKRSHFKNVNPNAVVGIKDVLLDHWATYGRSFFSRYDYENCASEDAEKLMSFLESSRSDFDNGTKPSDLKSTGKTFQVHKMYDFAYTDPVDSSVSKNQGQVVEFVGGSRVVFRLSGTGSSGATVRMYVEKYVEKEDIEQLGQETAVGLKDLIDAVLKWTNLGKLLKRDAPTVITVSSPSST